MNGSGASTTGAPEGIVAQLERAGVRAGRTALLEDIDLTVRAGERLAILGPNGAGKSTLLALLGAAIRPTAGAVRLFGADPWALRERGRALLRARIGVVAQRPAFQPLIPLTAREVVAMGRLRGRTFDSRLSADDWRRIDEALALLGAAHLADRPFRALSGGEQQKIQVARALAQAPDLLLLDEPASGLDLRWQEAFVQIIDDLARATSAAMVITTHLPHHLPVGYGRVVLLREGRLLGEGPASEMLTAGRLSDLYGCRVDVVPRAGRRYCLTIGIEAP